MPNYIILAHANPYRIVRLIEALESEKARFFVHYDRRSSDDEFGWLRGQLRDGRVTFLRRRPTPWGGYGLVSASISGLRAARELNPRSHSILLSGADFPIKSRTAIESFLERNQGRSFLRCWSLPDARWAKHADGLYRFDRWHVMGRHLPPLRWTERGDGPRRMLHRMQPYGGYQWFTLSAAASDWILTHLRRRPRTSLYFRTTLIPDEMMIPTLLMNSPHRGSVEDSLHYADWSIGGSHPRELTENDLQELLESRFLFGRKFNDDDTLASLARRL